jgi:hypothetical protein
MARTIRTIEAVTSSAAMEVDRDEGIIRGVKILGLVSDNNRKYMPEAVRKAKSLYEGIKVNINHPAESGDVRNAEDRFGKLINVKYVEGEGLYGDLMFLKSHPMAERICEAAERNDMNDTFGLSHNAQGDGQEDDDGCFVVNSIVEVRHVDLVADPATTKSLREARTRMKAKESKAEDNKSSRANVWKMNLKTYQISGGKKVLVLSKEAETTISSNGGTSDTKNVNNYGLLLAIAKSPKSGSYSTLGTSPKMHYEWSGGKIVKTIEEADMPNDEDKEMTESNQISSSIVSLEKQFENAVKQMHSINAGVSDFIKSNDVGPKTKQKFTKIRSDLSNAINVANKVKTDLVHMLHPGADGSENFSEEENMNDEDEMMTEAEDMPVEDPSEEEMTEASDSGKQEYAAKVKPLVQKADSLASEARQKLHDASVIVSNLSNHVSGKQLKKYLNNIGNLLSDSKQKCFDAEKSLSAAKSGDWDIDESINDEDEMMPEADDMPMDEADDELAIEAEDRYTEEEYSDDEEKMAMEGSSDNVGKTSREWDAHFEKQSPKMQSAINVGLHRGLSYPDAAKRAKSLVKEAVDNNEEDRMPMESKRRRLNTFCRNNGVTLTEGLYKDLRLLPEIAQRRCILRIKLAAKARKPKSSGSMMPMTESKVHTGDNVFNWLRS